MSSVLKDTFLISASELSVCTWTLLFIGFLKWGPGVPWAESALILIQIQTYFLLQEGLPVLSHKSCHKRISIVLRLHLCSLCWEAQMSYHGDGLGVIMHCLLCIINTGQTLHMHLLYEIADRLCSSSGWNKGYSPNVIVQFVIGTCRIWCVYPSPV